MTAHTLKPWDALYKRTEEEIARLKAAAKARNVEEGKVLALRYHTFNRATPDGRYDESRQQIADTTGFSIDQVSRALLALTDIGWLVTVEAGHGSGNKPGNKGRAPVRKVVVMAEYHANPERHEAGLTVVPDLDLDAEGGAAPLRRGGTRNQAVGTRNQAVGTRPDAALIESSFIEKPPTSLNETSVTAAKSGQGERRNLDDQCRAAGIDPTNLTALDKCKALAAASADEPDSSPPEALTEPPQPMPTSQKLWERASSAATYRRRQGGNGRTAIKSVEAYEKAKGDQYLAALHDLCSHSNRWRRWVLTGERYWLAQAICSQVEDGYVSEGVADRLDNPKPRETSSDRQRLYA